MKNINSKVVKLCRVIPFSQESNQDLTDFYSQATRGLGSYFPKGSKKAGTGLTFSEERLLMPDLLNLPSDDREFRKQLELYFVEITTKVPHEGLPLEIGLIDNKKPLSDSNLPISIEDYVRYKHAISHPQTAPSKETAVGNQLINFYILDETKTAILEKEENDIRDQALVEYISIKGNEEKVDMVLTNLGIDTRELDHNKLVLKLKEYIENKEINNSTNFINALKNPKLTTTYRLRKLIQANVLKLVGNVIVITESGAKIGNNMEQAVLWFEDASNSGVVGTLRARFQEFKKRRNIPAGNSQENLKEEGTEETED